jgi:hypothetical protein
MCEEYITNDTDAGKIAVLKEYFNNPDSLEFEFSEQWEKSLGFSDTRTLPEFVNGTLKYRIKNPDYKPKHVPQWGDIYKSNKTGLLRQVIRITGTNQVVLVTPELGDTLLVSIEELNALFTYTNYRINLDAEVEK